MPETLYNLTDDEVDWDPLAFDRAIAIRSEESACSELTDLIGDLFDAFTPGEIGRIMAGFFLIAKLKGKSFDHSELYLMRGAIAALNTAIIWERG